MTQFSKARWSTTEDEVRLGMDFSKVDKKRRMVYGWATLDNVDTENDVVTAEASAEAFARSRGNLREMHKKDSAVGRVVSFKEDTFKAPDGQDYRGIFVKVRVSEGAEDTWLKVLDGTLNGFSIGGNIVEAVEDFSKDGETKIRKVTKYDLNELSLVDNPGNQYSDITNVFKLRKSADGSVTSLTGMVEEAKMLNVFYCANEHNGIVKEAPSESYECPVCENAMKEIGFVEDTGDRDGKVNTLVTKFIGGGGETMPEEIKKSVDPEDEEKQTPDTGGDATEVGPDEVTSPVEQNEKDNAADVVEVEDEGEALTKKIDSLKGDIESLLNRSTAANAEKIAALEEIVKSATAEFNKKASELDAKVSELDKNLGVSKAKIAQFEKSLEKMNSGDALRKSADAETAPVVEQKNDPWEGSAFSVTDLIRRVS